jgi:NagD protein
MENATEAPKSSALYRNGHEIECWLTDMDGVLSTQTKRFPERLN